MLEDLSTGKCSPKQLKEFINEGGNLDGVTVGEAKVTLQFLMRNSRDHEGQVALVNLLRALSQGSLPEEILGPALHGIDAGADRQRVDYLVGGAFSSDPLRDEARRLVDGARHFMFSTPPQAPDDTRTASRVGPNEGGAPQYRGAVAVFHALFLGKDGKGVPGNAQRNSIVFADPTLPLPWAKVANFIKLMEHAPDSPARLICDHTKLDPAAAAIMLGDKEVMEKYRKRISRRLFKELVGKIEHLSSRVELVMVHDAQGYGAKKLVKHHSKAIVFKDYQDLAEQLYQRGVISAEQVKDAKSDRTVW
jgi:hypothetical protein